MRLRRCALVVVAMGAVSATTLRGQERPPVSPNTVVSAERWNLQVGQMLRIYTSGVGFVEGAVDGVRDQELLIRSGTTSTAIRLAWIDSLWVQTTAAKRGAIFGGVGGAVLGAVIGAVVCGSDCSSRATSTLIGTLVGGGGGAIGGGVIGSRFLVWRRRYP